MAEYAAYYGGPPAAGMPWPLFLACLMRTSRYEARAKLSQLEAVMAAIGGSLGGREVGSIRDELMAVAYPVKRQPSRLITNRFAPATDSPDA